MQNLLALRFANMHVRAAVERAAHRARADHRRPRPSGLEKRADFYDETGALRDMVQNHMLQLLALVAMEPPASFEAERGARREGQGAARAAPDRPGRERDRPVPRAARSAASRCPATTRSSASDSDTETFVALKAHVDNWRWKGVPFYLRTGKRLPERVTEIVVQFRQVPHSIFDRARGPSPTGC